MGLDGVKHLYRCLILPISNAKEQFLRPISPPCLQQPPHTSDLFVHPSTCCFPHLWLHVSFARVNFWILQPGTPCAANPILPTAPSSLLTPLPHAVGSGCVAPPKPAAYPQPQSRQLFWENHPWCWVLRAHSCPPNPSQNSLLSISFPNTTASIQLHSVYARVFISQTTPSTYLGFEGFSPIGWFDDKSQDIISPVLP